MIMWPKLQCLVTETELGGLSEDVKTKVEGKLVELEQLVESLKNENTELSAVSERQQFQCEKELFDCQNQLKESTETCMKLRSEITNLEQKLSSLNEQWRELQKVHSTETFELQSAKKSNELLTEEKRQLFEQVEKRKAEVDKLNEDTKCLLAQATSANEEKHATIAREEEAKLKVSSLKHQVGRLDREKSLMVQQVNDMHTELSQKNHEVYALRSEKSKAVLELQSELENRMDELHHLQEQVASLKEKSEEKDHRIDALARKIRSLNEASQEMEEQYQLQINAQTKLVEIFKKASEDDQSRAVELLSAFEHNQKLLQEAEESQNEIQSRTKAIESQYKSQMEKMELEVNRLKVELKHVSDLSSDKAFNVENLENFFPTAAATSKVMRSGMTFTQMYSEYVKAQEEIQNLKNENLRQSEQMKQIVSEIEENTPVINQRMTEYQKALETITCLRTQLTSTLTDQNILQTEKSDLKRKTGQFERENIRLKSQISDLNRQVQVLLKEVEELKGGVVKHGPSAFGEEEVSSTNEITAEKIISKHLVTFRDIVELQMKNQQLLAVVKELSEKHEQQERKVIEEKTAELQNDLKNAMSQVEDFRNERIKQTEMIQSIIRQRDMFRVLLTNQGFSDALLGSPNGSPNFNKNTTLSPTNHGDSTTKTAMNQLQSEFDNYRKEKAENERILNEKLEKNRGELSEMRIECAKLSAQLEYAEERLKLLQTNMDNYKKEAVFLREKNQKHTTLITQHQQKIHTLQTDLMMAQEKLAKEGVTLDNLRAERDLLKGIEQRLLHEKESLLHEQQHKSEVLANLQAMQNNMERFESETKRNLKVQVERYEKDTALLKMKVEAAQEQYQAAAKVWEKQEKELHQKINVEVEKNKKLHEDLVDAYSKFHSVSQQLTINKQNIAQAKTGDKNVPSAASVSASEAKSLKDQIMEAQAKIKGLQEQLDLTRKSSERYVTMCNDLELRVKEQDEINKTLNDNMESSIVSQNEARKKLEQHLEELEKSNRNLIEENMKLTQEKEMKLQELQAQLTELQKEIISHKSISETAAKTAKQAREDCLNQKKLMEETQEKYERELILHANDVEALSALKEEHQKCTTKIEELKNAVQLSEETLCIKEASWVEREKCISREQEALKQRVTDVEGHNEKLLSQIELMATQLAAFRSEDWDKLCGQGEGVDMKDTQHLLQIIQFVKKEKEILSSQFDATQSENVRLKMKIEHLTSELEDIKKEFKEVSENEQVRVASDVQHSELLRKIETLNLLTESNTLMRMEKESLVKEKQELESKVNKLEQEMQPLSKLNKETSSQIEMVSAENIALRQEVKNWQSRTNQLLEQSHRIGPQEYQNLTREMDELKNQKLKLAEELQRKQSETSHLNSTIATLKKEFDSAKESLQQKTDEATKKSSESLDHQRQLLTVKKIGRKYKTQYDELKALYDELVAKAAALESVTKDQSIQEMQRKLQESEKALKDVKEEWEKQKEKNEQEQVAQQKNLAVKEEKYKILLTQLRKRYTSVHNAKDVMSKENVALSKEIEDTKKEMDDMKKQIDANKQGSDEESIRVAALKSQYDSKIVRLERDLKMSRETTEYLEKQYEELCQKIALQQKPSVKSSAVGGSAERGSGSSEPLTANIKPLSSPSQSPSASLRHAALAASTSPRSTPTASIRPMAIGSVPSSSSSQMRMAAVLPTTASTSSIPSSIEEVSPASNVPHATVQPTPATATVAPTTIAITVTPSAHTPVISEVTTTPSGSAESTVVETPAPTASVIVSPPATQTQMVPPTVKRPRDGSPGSTESPDSSVSTQKRVRMISEGSQTNRQASVSATTSNVAIVSAATVVTRNKAEIPTSEVTPNIHVGMTESLPTIAVVSSTVSPILTVEEVADLPNITASTSSSDKVISLEPAVVEVVSEDQNIDWEGQENAKSSSLEFPVEIMDEEEEAGEHMEDFDDERVAQDEDMADEQEVEVVEMCEPHADDSVDVIDILDSTSDNQMEADSSSLQVPPGDQCMAPPAFPLTQVSEATSVADGIIGQPTSLCRRTPIAQRVQIRQDRLPSASRQHLQPFTISGQGPGFEEGDDSIVPSTPTLFVPRRTDGFAEAVSSPRIPSGRFLFSSTESSPTQQGLSQLASQGALGVDDTRMDLSQFDDGSGRTVPSTPLQVSPPTEASLSEVPDMAESTASDQSSDAAVPVPSIKIDSVEEHELKDLVHSQQTSSLHGGDSFASGDTTATDIATKSSTEKDEGLSGASMVPTSASSSESEVPKVEPGVGDGDSVNQGPPSQTQRKLIVWEKGDATVSASSAPRSISPSSIPQATQAAFSPPTSTTETRTRPQRARRMRSHRGTGAPTPNYQRGGSTTWTATAGRRGRGRVRRSMF